jgi:serine/threonine protein kinase
MASVYKAFDQTLRRPVAIKELTEQLRDNVDVRNLFLNEARKMAAVSHQNVIQVFDVSDDGDIPTIIMEYLEGGSVASRIGTGPVPVDEVLTVMKQVAGGLQAIHGVGLVHRDVKPENIIEDHGKYKIADFGVAMSGDEDALPFVTNKYAAPEVLLEPENIGPSSDIYSLGIMAIEMLLGPRRFEEAVREAIAADKRLQLPAIKDSAQAFWQRWVASPVELPPLNKIESTISPELASILADMTRRDRAVRISDGQTVVNRLDEVTKLGGMRAAANTEYSPKMKRRLDRKKAESANAATSSAKKKPLWFKLTLGVGGGLLIALAALLLIPSGPPRFYLEVATTPPGASVTVNGELLPNDPTPTWFNGAWGDAVSFQVDGQNPIEVVLSEDMDGLTELEEGFRLELGWSQPEWIATSRDAARILKQGLPAAWPLEVSLGTPGSELLDNGAYSVTVGTDLDFQVMSDQAASIVMIHLGSNDVLAVIYPNPLGVAPRLEPQARTGVGHEIGLVAEEPLGTEWFVFVAAGTLELPPEVPGVQQVGNWAAIYPFGEQGSPGENLVLWLLDTFGDTNASAAVIQIEVTTDEAG